MTKFSDAINNTPEKCSATVDNETRKVQRAREKIPQVSGFSWGRRGEGEERKRKREEKSDRKALRRVFGPLDEHDTSPQIVANQNNFRSRNCHVIDDRCERYELKLHTQLHCDALSKQNIFC